MSLGPDEHARQSGDRPDPVARLVEIGPPAQLVDDDVAQHLPAGGQEERQEGDQHGERAGDRVGARRPEPAARLAGRGHDQPREDDRRDERAPDLDGTREPDEDPDGGRLAPGHPRPIDGAGPGVGQRQQRQEQERALGGDQPRRPFDAHGDDPDGVQERGGERGASTAARRDQADEERVGRAKRHEAEPGGGECRSVGREPAEGGERAEQVHDPRRVQQGEVAIGDPTVDEREGGAHVDAVVVVDDPVHASRQQDRHEADDEGRDGDRRELPQQRSVNSEALSERSTGRRGGGSVGHRSWVPRVVRLPRAGDGGQPRMSETAAHRDV